MLLCAWTARSTIFQIMWKRTTRSDWFLLENWTPLGCCRGSYPDSKQGPLLISTLGLNIFSFHTYTVLCFRSCESIQWGEVDPYRERESNHTQVKQDNLCSGGGVRVCCIFISAFVCVPVSLYLYLSLCIDIYICVYSWMTG